VSREAEHGKFEGARDEQDHTINNDATPVAEVTAQRLDDNSAVQEASSAEPVWPDGAELFDLGLAMLCGGTGVPVAPTKNFAPAIATHELLVRVTTAIASLKKAHGTEMHMVPGTAGRIDQQEGRGYLLGAVLGRGLISREQAKTAGLDARNKLAALNKRLVSQQESARRAASAAHKTGRDDFEKQAAAAAADRTAIERERVELDLPQPPKPRSAAGHKRAAPSPADPMAYEARFGRWCKRRCYTPLDAAFFKRLKGHEAWESQEYRVTREWNPRSWTGRLQLAKLKERDIERNDLCTCNEGVPSWLCRVTRCCSFEVVDDGGCEERALPGCHSCMCMAGAWDDKVILPNDRPSRANGNFDMIVDWDPAPVPAGGWPPINPGTATQARRAEWRARFFAGRIDDPAKEKTLPRLLKQHPSRFFTY
jgi:hypothetical protein